MSNGCGRKQGIGYKETITCGEGFWLCSKCKKALAKAEERKGVN